MYLINLVILLMLLTVASVRAQEPLPAVFVDVTEIIGLDAAGDIPESGANLSIPVRFHNVDTCRTVVSNGFYFYSPDATVGNIAVEWNPTYPWNTQLAIPLGCFPPPTGDCYAWFDLGTYALPITKGLGGFFMAGLALNGAGLPPDFDDVAYTFHLTNVAGPPGGTLTMDTTWWEPSNYWLWSGVGADVSWGGPYVARFAPCCEFDPYTTCWPQPIELGVNDNDRVLNVSIFNEDNALVDLASVRVLGKIPCLTNDGVAWIEGDSIVTDCSLMRFLGSGGFRPLPPDNFIGVYFVTYDTDSGESVTLFGDFSMAINQADVTFDGLVNIDDALFMTEHLFGDGPSCALDGYEMDEMIDVDQNGRFDLLDVRALIEMIM